MVAEAPTTDAPAFGALQRRGRVPGAFVIGGPAFVAAVAYIDPGNFATNFAAGAEYGYALVWVIVGPTPWRCWCSTSRRSSVWRPAGTCRSCAGTTTPGRCRARSGCRPRSSPWRPTSPSSSARRSGSTWCSASRCSPAGLITAVVAFAILALEQRGHRKFELAIVGLLGLVLLGFAYDLATVGEPGGVRGGSDPAVPGLRSGVLAAGIIGATVMPHVVYLHSALTKNRVSCADDGERRVPAQGLPGRRGGRARRPPA